MQDRKGKTSLYTRDEAVQVSCAMQEEILLAHDLTASQNLHQAKDQSGTSSACTRSVANIKVTSDSVGVIHVSEVEAKVNFWEMSLFLFTPPETFHVFVTTEEDKIFYVGKETLEHILQ